MKKISMVVSPSKKSKLIPSNLRIHFRLRLIWVRSKVESENIKCKIIRQQQGEAAWGTSGQVARI